MVFNLVDIKLSKAGYWEQRDWILASVKSNKIDGIQPNDKAG